MKSSSPDGIVISTGIQKHVNEGIKSKRCDGSGSGGRLNRPLALLEITKKLKNCNVMTFLCHCISYIYLTQSDCFKNCVLTFPFQIQSTKDHK